MRCLQRLLGLMIGAAAACGDSAPVGIPVPCTGKCVPEFPVSPSHLILTPGDTARLTANARTGDGDPVQVRWSTTASTVEVDSGGLVTAKSTGVGWAHAHPATDSTPIAIAHVWVVTPDTGGQPFIASFRDAATGALLNRHTGFADRDSIDMTFSYVVGHQRQTAGPPSLVFEIRNVGWSAALARTSVPAPVRGRAAFAHLRLHLTQRDSTGARRFPKGVYDFFILLPLADGQRLGDRTGYTVSY